MIKPSALFAAAAAVAFALLTANTAQAQSKVASYATGKPGTEQYEELSFWVKDGKRADIYYTRGKNRNEIRGNYLPQTGKTNGASFAVRLADDRLLTIIPSGSQLKVADSATDAPRTFAWKYEGPVNGVGTFCRECTANPKEAMELLRAYYLK
ncbi:hypothetical protein [Hymenobacter properus]|uniref:Uncharacterized protein n=1 Tax=Hymenobacter properus TaxID=2791026 RepID=A0A931BES9_9BACT|nr:hypothetical protein [Hymenobacter properus]MBF9140002.1 hypothetical protein [Hymenobacter properus]MBR7718809.1 hypothetical protein [Microvirga sp. SRT04]